MSSLFVPDSVARNEGGIGDADLSAQFAAHAQEAKRRERKGQWHLLFILVFVLGPLVVYPLARLVMLSVTGPHGFTLHAYTAFFGNPETRGMIGMTLGILFASASIASLLGVALASMLFFRPFAGARLLTRFLELFVAFPSFLVAFTLIFLYGSQGSVSIGLQRLFSLDTAPLDFLFGIGGVILAEVVFYAPFVVRPTLASYATLDMRLVEAAKSLGADGWMVATKVVLPLAWPGIAAGTILCFLLTLNEFGILLVLGSAHLITLPIAIYSAATVDLDLPTAAAGSVVMLLMSLSLYALYRRVDRRSGGR
ncbi:binding-protein-dependent transport systems inner membrane component [Caballeronia calidae]|uniref:Binding-protein-dependent transport systems inner membrane component n=1 Tax=Caballeronia calidae TaxID=1777139 RepID=A0A158AEB1_9BURK|nr:2-aminoethylphosphonate ABC transporter permease subunit [Caballeronia calidae]SAK56192.1 binding-protein-dependent transport systems inner membrane component [Caballeronia calidae]